MKTGTLIMTTLLVGCMAATAQATTVATKVVRQKVVSYADLDLKKEAGAQTLLRRIKFAARRVCETDEVGMISLEIVRRQQKCADDATARAVADVDSRTISLASVRP